MSSPCSSPRTPTAQRRSTKEPPARPPSIRVHPPSLSITTTDLSDDASMASGSTQRRWSDLVPPQTALTFVAMYDPSEGLMSFSGASLLPSTPANTPRVPSPNFPSDGQSEVFTIDRLAAGTPALSTAALTSDTAMADMQSLLDAYFRAGTPAMTTYKTVGDARASSAMEDVYPCSWGGMGASAPYLARVSRALLADNDEESLFAWSWLDRLGDTLILNPYIDTRVAPQMEDSDSDRDGTSPFNDSGYADDSACFADQYAYFGERDDGAASSCFGPNEHSAFSVTTTSTSDYIDVHAPPMPTPDAMSTTSTTWSTLEAPDQRSLNFLACCNATALAQSPTSPTTRRARRLLKPRSCAHLPAKPAVVLARQSYNHDVDASPSPTATSPSSSPGSRAEKQFGRGVWRRLSRFRKDGTEGAEPWVCVEVKHMVTQRDLRDRDFE